VKLQLNYRIKKISHLRSEIIKIHFLYFFRN